MAADAIRAAGRGAGRTGERVGGGVPFAPTPLRSLLPQLLSRTAAAA